MVRRAPETRGAKSIATEAGMIGCGAGNPDSHIRSITVIGGSGGLESPGSAAFNDSITSATQLGRCGILNAESLSA